MLGNGTSVASPVKYADLERLYNSLDENIRNSPDGIKYAEKLKQLKPVN
jgi:hypothetical protein